MPEVSTSRDDGVAELYQDENVRIVAAHGIAYYLTACCGASGKGSDGGIVCRSCYREVDSLYALGWPLKDDRGWAQFRHHMRANHPVTDELLDAMRATAG